MEKFRGSFFIAFVLVIIGLFTYLANADTGTNLFESLDGWLITDVNGGVAASATTDQFAQMNRSIICFDTSGIGSTSTVSAATLSFFAPAANPKGTGLGAPDLVVTTSSPASTAALANADHNKIGFTSLGSIAEVNWTGNQYNDISLNSTGLSYINTTGVSCFGAMTSWESNNSFTGTWASGANSFFSMYWADEVGTSADPKLVVTYATTSQAVATISTMQTIWWQDE